MWESTEAMQTIQTMILTSARWIVFYAALLMYAQLSSSCAFAQDAGAAAKGEVLYNGIQLPEVWPPRDLPVSRDPMPLPYLKTPPAVIPIDVGRQLFVDDFLVQETTLTRTHHAATYYPNNPVLKPDSPWESEGSKSQEHPAPTAMVFSDGVWFDPQDNLFKMWYMGGYTVTTCYATSKDGIHWDKPMLDVVPNTNIVQAAKRDSTTVWLDLLEKDPARRYKLFEFGWTGKSRHNLSIFFSSDGIHWGDPVGFSGTVGDRTTVFYNPFRNVWVYGIRDYDHTTIGRFRRYAEGADVLAAAQWEDKKSPFWVGADNLDPQRDDLKTPCELYNLDAVAYESLLVGLFSIWRGQPKDRAKPNEICVGYTRDGFHWDRPTHEPFIPVSEKHGDWNWGNVQSAGGCCLVVGDQLYFYMSGRSGVQGSPASGTSATGLATLRRDGFASMDAGETEGVLTTRPVAFKGKYLYVNVDNPDGQLLVEVLDENGKAIKRFKKDKCTPISTNSTIQRVTWKKTDDLSALAGESVRFRFHLTNGKLYSFWVSPDESGASHGYVAAGGPGFTGPTDTVGAAAQ